MLLCGLVEWCSFKVHVGVVFRFEALLCCVFIGEDDCRHEVELVNIFHFDAVAFGFGGYAIVEIHIMEGGDFAAPTSVDVAEGVFTHHGYAFGFLGVDWQDVFLVFE